MTHDEKISQMARYMDKHGSRTEYDMRKGKSEHKPATMSFEDFRKSEKKPSPARSNALKKKKLVGEYKDAKDHRLGKIGSDIKSFRRHFEKSGERIENAHKSKEVKFY
jgi:hypothetical protein